MDLHLPSESANEISQLLNNRLSESNQAQKILLKNLKTERTKLKNRKTELLNMRLDKEITTEDYDLARNKINKEIQNLTQRIEKMEYDPALNDVTSESIIELAKSLKKIYLKETPERKAILLNILASNCILNLLFDGSNLRPLWKKPLCDIAKAASFLEKLEVIEHISTSIPELIDLKIIIDAFKDFRQKKYERQKIILLNKKKFRRNR